MSGKESENHFKTRRGFVKSSFIAIAGAGLSLCTPRPSVADSPGDSGQWRYELEFYEKPRLTPYWLEKSFSHLELSENESTIENVASQFSIDPHVLLALLITESPLNTNTSYAGAEGAFQIIPQTRLGLIQMIDDSPILTIKRDSLNISVSNLKDPDSFKAGAFLACVYLEEAGVPRGKISSEAQDYERKLEAVRKAAIRYHDGINCDVENPTENGRLEGERVVAILELLKGSKKKTDISSELAYFLGIQKP
ncbi:hypothetical protein C4578_01935 [Candidatus Microgenomates bacterium]|jgi:hypothetical protein|nr:MAG: hypothetical protein C4578_01935 [Candidatus Microgenomates bacterium]